jgi:hydroxyethylthiazole kinase-like uncharacterized protein yjeF
MSVPVVTIAQMREWEEMSWAAGRDVREVMRDAGAAIAARASAMTCEGDSILLLVGKGNNGGDTKLSADRLGGRKVRLLEVEDPLTAIEEIDIQLAARPALVIDGLFGIGLNRSLNEDWRRLIECVNSSTCPLLAVDVPSGLNADSGEPMAAAIRADVTVTFAAPKLGLIKTSATEYTGRLEVAPDIGLIDCPHDAELHWVLPGDFVGFPPSRPPNSHKGTFGHLGIIAGSVGWHGAAVLAARAALRSQPGLVSVVTTEGAWPVVAAQLAQPMVHPWSGTARKVLSQCTAILMGPGLAGDLPDEMREEISRLWREYPRPVIADASALDLLPVGESAAGLRVITPHPGEAARLLDITVGKVQADRPATLRELAEKLGCHVILKGNQTLSGGVTGRILCNSTGNPSLAQGGSGDVLAGFLGGLLAQPRLIESPGRTLAHSIWKHGLAADCLTQECAGWGMEELIFALK